MIACWSSSFENGCGLVRNWRIVRGSCSSLKRLRNCVVGFVRLGLVDRRRSQSIRWSCPRHRVAGAGFHQMTAEGGILGYLAEASYWCWRRKTVWRCMPFLGLDFWPRWASFHRNAGFEPKSRSQTVWADLKLSPRNCVSSDNWCVYFSGRRELAHVAGHAGLPGNTFGSGGQCLGLRLVGAWEWGLSVSLRSFTGSYSSFPECISLVCLLSASSGCGQWTRSDHGRTLRSWT